MGAEREKQFLAPKYWPTWLLLSAMRCCAVLPLSVLQFAGKLIGEAVYLLLPSRRRIARTNIKLCFPELSSKERSAIVRKCFHGIGMSLFETALAWWGGAKRLDKLVEIEGLHHIERAQKENRPILLLSGHMCCTDIGARLLASHTPFQAMYKPAKNKLIDAVMFKKRSQFYQELVPRKKSRRLLKNLKNGFTTWYGPDQSFGREDTVFAPFFGVQAITLTATSRLAKFANAVVIPYFPYRLPHSKGFRLLIHPPLENFPSDSIDEDATHVNQIIEQAARAAPEQYLWLHRRFRHRPEGEEQIY